MYAGVGKPEVKRLRELEREDARHKMIVADFALDNDDQASDKSGPAGDKRS
ncbi:MAG: hypothetical protein AAFN13_00450 [Bacteroidota bacterium]